MTKQSLEELFFKLIEYTYIHGYEDEVYNNILPKTLKMDQFGNYYIKIGDSKTIFTSHLDTVGKKKVKVNYKIYDYNGTKFVKTDGKSILGGDDKAGVVIMINMIDNNVPGLYYFLIGEECGTIGSKLLTKNMPDMLSKYDRCIAFDRRGYGSIINRQMGKYCCSDEFASQLSKMFGQQGMKFKADPYGVWTDSALFMGIVPECTNLSVGYHNEHKDTEEQDIDYMLQMADVATRIDWEKLPVVRQVESHDTKDPDYTYKIGDLPTYKLHKIFDEVDDAIYSYTKMLASNYNFFLPDKEMTYFNVKDLQGKDNFSLFIHPNGSITLSKGDVTIKIKNINTFRRINSNKRLIKNVLRFDRDMDIS